MELVTIVNGHLITGKRSFPLSSDIMDPRQFSYSGEAMLYKNEIRITMGRTTVYDFEVGEATQESLDYEAGYERGLKQKRLYVPKRCSTDFYYGLVDAHREKAL